MKRHPLCGALALLMCLAPLGAGAQNPSAPKKVDPVTGEAASAPKPAAPAQPAKAGVVAAAPAPAAKAEPPPPPPEKVDPKIFDEAVSDYFAKNPRDAARKLYAFLQVTSTTDENYAWAQLFLAKSLIDLGLRHAGAVYLAQIARQRSNPVVIPRALQELHALTFVPHDETMIDEQVFGALDLGFLPDDVASFAHYQQGLLALKVGNERWALNHFAKLADNTPEASRAKYALLVKRLKDVRGDVPHKLIDEFLELSKDEKLNQQTRNEAMLAVARLRYEKKDFSGALEAYRSVKLPELDPGQASLYLEEAWTRYNLGQLHAAMGLLTALDAPLFRDEFLPDKYILRALIYRDLCHYLPAKRAAKELVRRFGESLDAIHNREDLTLDLRLRKAASSEGSTMRAARFAEALSLEAERIGRYAGSFGDRLVAHLTKLYDLAHAEAIRVYEQRLRESVRVQADRLLRAAEQVRLMDYEVGLKLYERIKKGSKLVQEIKEPDILPSQITFKFDGEYWNDELRDYRFSLQSRCIEEKLQ